MKINKDILLKFISRLISISLYIRGIILFW